MAENFDTLVELLERSAAKYGSSEALGTKLPGGAWRWTTFSELSSLVAQVCGGLRSLGVAPGDRVGIVADNRLEWAVLAFATYRLGAVFVPMYQAQPAKEWSFILKDCEAKVVFGANQQVYEDLLKVAAEVPSLEHVLGLELPESDSKSYRHVLKIGATASQEMGPVKGSDLAALIYTSGTTGDPKGVQLTHANLCSNVLAASQRFDFGPGDRSLAFLPWAHCFGQTAELYTLLWKGCAIAINDAVPNLISNLPEVKPTVLVAVPRIFNRIYDGVNKQMQDKPAPIRKLFHAAIAAANKQGKGESLGFGESLALSLGNKLIFSKVRQKFGGRLRFVVSGSAALSVQVAEFIDALGIAVFEGYGLTETSPVVSANYPGHRKIGSVGPAFPGVEIRIDREATGDPVHGEIIVSGPNVMQGYYKRPEENGRVLLPDGSFRTGDMGYLDEDGFLYITGRIKEQYKLETGKYVVPSPLEEELKLSPFILNVMLYGENRSHNVALVVLDEPAVEKWATDEGVALHGDITNHPDVKKLISSELTKYSAAFKNYEKPQGFKLITEDFTLENDMLTPSMKVKRRNVLSRYESDLLALYG